MMISLEGKESKRERDGGNNFSNDKVRKEKCKDRTQSRVQFVFLFVSRLDYVEFASLKTGNISHLLRMTGL
jgi:hypothetical protein